MKRLPSGAQGRLLKRLEKNRGGEPDVATLARGLGVHQSTVQQHLGALPDKGVICPKRRRVGRKPLIALRSPLSIPLVGSIPVGPLADALEHPEGYLALPFGPEHEEPTSACLYGAEIVAKRSVRATSPVDWVGSPEGQDVATKVSLCATSQRAGDSLCRQGYAFRTWTH